MLFFDYIIFGTYYLFTSLLVLTGLFLTQCWFFVCLAVARDTMRDIHEETTFSLWPLLLTPMSGLNGRSWGRKAQ